MGVEPGAQVFDWHEPEPEKKAGFGKWKNPKSPYDRFIESQGIPIHRAIGVHKVQDLPLMPNSDPGPHSNACFLAFLSCHTSVVPRPSTT